MAVRVSGLRLSWTGDGPSGFCAGLPAFIAYDPDQSGDRDCYAPFIEGAFNVEPGKGQFVNEVMRLEVYDDEYEDDCVIQKKHFVYLPSVKFMGAFNMRMMMSMVDAQYN